MNKDGVKVAVLTFTKCAFRLGETVCGVVELNDLTGRARVLQVCLSSPRANHAIFYHVSSSALRNPRSPRDPPINHLIPLNSPTSPTRPRRTLLLLHTQHPPHHLLPRHPIRRQPRFPDLHRHFFACIRRAGVESPPLPPRSRRG